MSQPRSGYTLPVFACAAAMGALFCLRRERVETVRVDLLEPPRVVSIPIEQAAPLDLTQALAIARSDPGDNLDLTRNTPVWALVKLKSRGARLTPSLLERQIILQGGEGIGKRSDTGDSAIYQYAQKLLQANLERWLQPDEQIIVTIILPEGRNLAQRTSNAAFGVVEGLSLLGTTGISQPLSAPGQLEAFQQELAAKATFSCLVFCVGENGLDLAQKLGIPSQQLVKTANWLGPLLVSAGVLQIPKILLLGYHGKLIKLAGGIFHTHHHLADGRLEILTAYCANLGLSTPIVQQVFKSPTAEAALQLLQQVDVEAGSSWVKQIYEAIAATIDRRAQDYIRKHSEQDVSIGSILFDRDRRIIATSRQGTKLLSQLC